MQLWAERLGDIPWPLLPVGNRPLLEYWFEVCLDLGIQEVRLVLGEGAEFIEAYAGGGERWGLSISYSFLKEGKDPESFLKRDPAQWEEGLFYLRNPVFLHRLTDPGVPPAVSAGETFLDTHADGTVNGLLSYSPAFLRAFISNPRSIPVARPMSDFNFKASPILSIKDYYDVNMKIVGEAAPQYLRAGYSRTPDVSIGYNVVLSPSVTVNPPVAIGNNCRFGAMTTVGPLAVVGSHVIVDRQADLSECVILDGTYVGRGLEIHGKIVAGSRLIDPENGEVAEINDPWLVASVKSTVKWCDACRAVFGWGCAVILILLQVGPFCVLYPLVKYLRKARFRRASVHLTKGRVGLLPEYVPGPGEVGGMSKLFQALNLDLFPRLCRVATGHLWLCGVRPMSAPGESSLLLQVKEYFPSVLVYDTDERDYAEPGGHLAHALFYARFRSFFGDVRMVLAMLLKRPLRFLSSND